MFGTKTVENIRSDVDEHATELRAELERATARLTVALVIVGALAAFAVVYSVARTSNGKMVWSEH
jgi:hypothetical protein